MVRPAASAHRRLSALSSQLLTSRAAAPPQVDQSRGFHSTAEATAAAAATAAPPVLTGGHGLWRAAHSRPFSSSPAPSSSSSSPCAPVESEDWQYLLVDVSVSDGTAVIQLNRPEALNALCDGLCVELIAALGRIDADDRIRCLVLTGAGQRAFAAGADVKQMAATTFEAARRVDLLALWNKVQEFRKPLVAAVNGFALGGGCELAMACDIILASDRAKFGQPEILIGTIPGMGGSQRLTRAAGKSRAMEWILTGDQFDAEAARHAGLVSRVVPAEDLLREAQKLAAKIAAFSGPAAMAAKECVNRAYESSLQEGLLFERRAFHSSFATADRAAGMDAFVQKKKATWVHK
eukprot:GHVT01020208.1.p1 GENE.GHVT01020208.1~~GHVT01020208.1.p1  ORF type:complete len:363 (-),score=110.68 GHVT01020208.1:637-1686(-)